MVVRVYATEESQFAVVYKVANDAKRDGEKALRAIEVTFRVAEKLLVDPEDAQRIEDALIDKAINIEDVMKLFTGGIDAEQTPATPPRRVRRAR
jgi:uncharacterized protein (DUF2267 family)